MDFKGVQFQYQVSCTDLQRDFLPESPANPATVDPTHVAGYSPVPIVIQPLDDSGYSSPQTAWSQASPPVYRTSAASACAYYSPKHYYSPVAMPTQYYSPVPTPSHPYSHVSPHYSPYQHRVNPARRPQPARRSHGAIRCRRCRTKPAQQPVINLCSPPLLVDENERTNSFKTGALDTLQDWYSSRSELSQPSAQELVKMASATGLSRRQVLVWWTNRRKQA